MSKIHPNNMGKKQLRELVSAMMWTALDLAQELCMLRELYGKKEIPDSLVRRAYMLAGMPHHDADDKFLKWKYQVLSFSEDGLNVEMGKDIAKFLGVEGSK